MPIKRGMNSNDIKFKNRGLVLKLAVMGKDPSRISITRETGLSKMTVTNITAGLINDGYLIETCRQKSGAAGRSPVLLDISPKAPVILGVYIARDKMEAALSDLRGALLWRDSVKLQAETSESIRSKLSDMAKRACSSAKNRIMGIGVAAIGPIDQANGIILNPTNFYGIENLPVKYILESVCNAPVYTSNDANAAALAELLLGAGRRLDNFIYIGVSDGIGAGIISGKALYQNGSGYAGEVGHTTINFDGELCGCGNKGCLELYANISVLLKRIAETSGYGEKDIAPSDFEEFSKSGKCDIIFKDVAVKLAYALINMINLFNPQKIFFGHEGAFIPVKYLNFIEEFVNQRIFASRVNKVRVERAHFGAEAPLYGSVCCVLDKLFNGEIFL